MQAAHESPRPLADKVLTVALAGNPNCGKSTLFNALTGLRQKVANYPGVTVEKKTGRCRLDDNRWAEISDLPGTYSLVANSPDETVTMEVLRGMRAGESEPDVIVAVIDANNLGRNLYLLSQLIELGKPVVVALNMMDVAERNGIRIDHEKLAVAFNTPVVPVVASRGRGIDVLKAAIARAEPVDPPSWPLPEAMSAEIQRLRQIIAQTPIDGKEHTSGKRHALNARRLLTSDPSADLAAVRADPVVAAEVRSAADRLGAIGVDPVKADIEGRYRWIDALVEMIVSVDRSMIGRTVSDRIDAVLMHRVVGMIVFVAIMAGLFVSIFFVADPIMSAIGDWMDALGKALTRSMADGPLKSLITDGLVAGVGNVVVFLPQIVLLFLFLSILEDTGYLARAAFIMDRVLSRVGLNGKSFIPLLSSFACAIPGIMATRTIANWRERMATIMVAPFMSCSARLPVYGLLIGAFFAGYGAVAKGLIMLGCYLLGIVAAAAIAWAFSRVKSKRGLTAISSIMELPTYQMPQVGHVARQVWSNASQFLRKAGTTIFCLSVLLWALAYYPRMENAPENPELAGQAQLEYSYAGRIGHTIEPAIAPLGFDWKIGVGLVGAFAAREVFNSYLGIIYSVGDPGEDTDPLAEAIVADRKSDGTPVWTPLVAVSLLVWFVLAMQCMSTFAVVKRETGGWTWPIAQLVAMNAIAYTACLIVYQIGIRWMV